MLNCPHCSGPLQLLPAGVAPTVEPRPDLDATLLEYLKVVQVTDVAGAARHLYDVEHPGRALLERTRRMLDRSVAAGIVVKSPGSSGGRRGGLLSLYRLLSPGR